MREIKFRAWHTGRKEMFSAEQMGKDQMAILPDGTGFWNIHGTHTRLSQQMSQMIPMQYTGLKLGGNEIYEGDIIEWQRENGEFEIGGNAITRAVVEWCGLECRFKLRIKRLEGGMSPGIRSGEAVEFDCALWPLTKPLDITITPHVIGNIYENPELLK